MLRDDFEEQGPHGVHLCLVMDILSTDVSSFRRSAPGKCLPLYMTRMIVALIVKSLESLHDLNIIHAGLSGSDYMTNKHLQHFDRS
jgi:serine/threonine-protein kinase SRPK3